ncbi:ThiF family adenylyltransferase [Vibrio fluvialis]|uniref:ThiF family adenylyltransferase n=1 Tax=Vibrio fluvialis TaxID=676 RepID=UPI001C9C4A28|nr:ThiF family adenylyltransferase [Vibrio fluvialis]ELO1777440.1 ThiF family adenylyltransferase [Vibrio fluvialis]MBY8221049.1 ThiF family adenylyltransferase [Vibrio fluvialis]MCG6382018.1 ThiF family adenylyltransferase [Vibrio fluvialis]
MFQKLVSHNSDLKRLIEKGYAVAFDSTNHLVFRDIPYLDANGDLQIGAIVAKLKFINNDRFEQNNHQIYFAGEMPYGLDGKQLPNLANRPDSITLSPLNSDVVVQRSFSNKPKRAGKYTDHFHKIETYIAMISGPAMTKFNVTPYTFRVCEQSLDDPIFKFRDTLTSRANLNDLSEKLSNEVVAIIGLGGTGSYVLDFIIKTPVREVRGYDGDFYHVHNSYRSPGRLDESDLGQLKSTVFRERYQNFRHGLSIKNMYIDASTSEELQGVTFAFVCVDNGDSRKEIFDVLVEREIPFIDVGLGLKRSVNESLTGMMRTTYFSKENAEKVRSKKCANESEDPNNLYKANVQISELNALNACLAVLRYKQLKGFYYSNSDFFDIRFNISSFLMVGEDNLDED